MKRAKYGIDAPLVVQRFVGVGVVALSFAVVLRSLPRVEAPGLVRWALIVVAVWTFMCALTMLLGSKVGKLRLRDGLLARVPCRGDERVLDSQYRRILREAGMDNVVAPSFILTASKPGR
jgi:hypothetical protein